jgi:adenosylhomocysteinase
MILDDGGDATMLVHKGVEFEKAGGARPDRGPRRGVAVVLEPAAYARSKTDPTSGPAIAEPDQGRHRGDHHRRAPPLPDARARGAAVPGDQRQRLGHQEQVRQQVRLPPLAHRRHQPRHRRDDRRQGRGGLRLRRRGQGLRGVAAGQGARVIVTEIDPICALQAAMEGYQVATLEDVRRLADIFITATGNYDVITVEHMAAMKDKAIVGNIGHFDNEIDMAGLGRGRGRQKTEIKPQVDEWTFAGRPRPLDHRAVRGPAAEPRQRHRAPELRDEQLVHQPDHRADRAVHQDDEYPLGVYTLPKHLDEKVARLHLDALGVQADRADQGAGGVPRRRRGGPYKPEHYRY